MSGRVGRVFAKSGVPSAGAAGEPAAAGAGRDGAGHSAPSAAPGTRIPLRILTYNIHKGYCSGNRRFVLEEMRHRIAETGADLAFLQEVHGHRAPDGIATYPDRPHFEYVADRAWPHYAYGRNAIYRKGDHGNAILSKFPIATWENIDVARFPRSSRSILHGVVEIPGVALRLHVLCVHFGLLESERRGQVALLGQRLARHVPADEPLILAGDFNDWGRRVGGYLHDSLGVEELFLQLEGRHARTWPIRRPLFAMDRIYYRGVEPLACRALGTGEWRTLSDHVALLGDFRLTVPATGA
jgi:endonuclease/exonuclease/phosphatase family metal-dependent hydrolase